MFKQQSRSASPHQSILIQKTALALPAELLTRRPLKDQEWTAKMEKLGYPASRMAGKENMRNWVGSIIDTDEQAQGYPESVSDHQVKLPLAKERPISGRY
jgi:hypothetical protein